MLDKHIAQRLSENYRDCSEITMDPQLGLMNDVLISRGIYTFKDLITTICFYPL